MLLLLVVVAKMLLSCMLDRMDARVLEVVVVGGSDPRVWTNCSIHSRHLWIQS